MKTIWIVEGQRKGTVVWIPVDVYRNRESARANARFANEIEIGWMKFRVSKYVRIEK